MEGGGSVADCLTGVRASPEALQKHFIHYLGLVQSRKNRLDMTVNISNKFIFLQCLWNHDYFGFFAKLK